MSTTLSNYDRNWLGRVAQDPEAVKRAYDNIMYYGKKAYDMYAGRAKRPGPNFKRQKRSQSAPPRRALKNSQRVTGVAYGGQRINMRGRLSGRRIRKYKRDYAKGKNLFKIPIKEETLGLSNTAALNYQFFHHMVETDLPLITQLNTYFNTEVNTPLKGHTRYMFKGVDHIFYVSNPFSTPMTYEFFQCINRQAVDDNDCNVNMWPFIDPFNNRMFGLEWFKANFRNYRHFKVRLPPGNGKWVKCHYRMNRFLSDNTHFNDLSGLPHTLIMGYPGLDLHEHATSSGGVGYTLGQTDLSDHGFMEIYFKKIWHVVAPKDFSLDNDYQPAHNSVVRLPNKRVRQQVKMEEVPL